MANETAHVVEKRKKITIFSVFDRLLKGENKREKSCAVIIDYLKENNNKVGSATSASYSTKRIVRGLSTQDAEKQNIFFSALCTFLAADSVSTDLVLEALKNITENAGSSQVDQKAAHVASILTYGAIVVSGKFNDVTENDQTVISEQLMAACNSKLLISCAASAFLLQLIKDSSKKFSKNVLLPLFVKFNKEKNAEDFIAILAFAYLTHSKTFQKLIDQSFGGRNKFLENVTLRGCHFSFHLQEETIKKLCADISLSGKGKQLLQLWTNLIEMEPKPHPARNPYILLFFKTILDVLPDSDNLALCLHINLVDLLFKALQVRGKKENEDVSYKRSKEVLEKLCARINQEEKKSAIALSTIKKIFSCQGGFLFDKRTGTNTVQLLMESLESGDITHLADELVSKIKECSSKGESKDIPLIIAILTKVINLSAVRKLPALITNYVQVIFDTAFLKSFNVDVKTKILDYFYKAMDLNHVKLEDAVVVLNDLVNHADKSLISSKFKESSVTQWNSMLAANKEMGLKSKNNKYLAIRVLLLHMGLLMFRDEELASSTIAELLQCHQRIKERKRKSNTSQNDSNGEPHWVEVTVDLMLAMLSRENKLLRHVVSSVFPRITSDLTASAIQQIIDALDPTSRNDVLKHVDSDDSDDDAGSDNEVLDDEDDFEDDEGDDDSPGSATEDEEETVNDKLRMAVRSALGYSAALTDDEDADMDDMNEEEEERLNESLSNAFRLFRPSKSSKKKQTKDDESLMHFRIRVLDIVEVILNNSPSLSTCLELQGPLFILLEFSIKDSRQKPLQNRLESVIKKLGNLKKFANEDNVTYEDVLSAFRALFEKDTPGMVCSEMAPAITDCCAILLRSAQLLSPESSSQTLADVFDALLDRYFRLNDRKIPYSVFQLALRMLWDGNWDISKKIMTLMLDANIKIFKKIKLVELMEVFYRNDRLHSTATDDTKKAVCQFEYKFVKKFSKMLDGYSSKSVKLLPLFYNSLVNFIQVALQSNSKYRENCVPAPDWKSVVSYLLENLHKISQQKARNKLICVAQQCNLPIPSKKELKAISRKAKLQNQENDAALQEEPTLILLTPNSADAQGEPKSIIKRKSGDNFNKFKKESKKKRSCLLSEGLEDVNFSNIDTFKLIDLDGAEEPSSKKSRNSSETKSLKTNKVKSHK